MSTELQFELCPETGIGCLMFNPESDPVKIDLMPDEADDLMSMVKAGDLEGAKSLLAGIDGRAKTVLDGDGMEALVREIG